MSNTPNQTKKIETPQTPDESTSDIYSVFQEGIDRYFKEVKANAANYLQAASDLQEEIIESRKNNAKHAISLQKAVYEKLGGKSEVSNPIVDLAKAYASEANQAWNLQNQIMLTSLDTLSKNIEAYNKNSMVFENINKRLIDYWASIIRQTGKQQS